MTNIRIQTAEGESTIQLGSLPNNCPYCKVAISPLIRSSCLRDLSQLWLLDIVFKCPNASCRHLFIGEYTRYSGQLGITSCYDFIKISAPDYLPITQFPAEIMAMFSDFVAIYNQAECAEESGLDRIAGMGYRKSLEFLVKDFLIDTKPADAESIKKSMLGNCIQMVENQRIKDIANRATWIGNDETHYVRKWINKDIGDLKALIKLVVNYIEAELLYKETMKTMQNSKSPGQ